MSNDTNELLTEARNIAETEGEISEEQETRYSEIIAEVKKIDRKAEMIAKVEEHEAHVKESRGRVFQPEQPDLPKDEKRGYSIMKAVSCLVDGHHVDGLEGEISQELCVRNNKSTAGFFMPLEFRALDTTTGSGAVPTGYSNEFIDSLKNKTVVMEAGATVLGDLEGYGSQKFAKKTGAGTAYWIIEGADTTTSEQAIGNVEVSPYTIAAQTDITRQQAKRASFSMEKLVVDDLTDILALGIDYACLNGDGTTEPFIGVLQDSNTNLVVAGDGTNGQYLTRTKCLDFEKEIYVDNAMFDPAVFVTGPKQRSRLKSTDVAYTTDGTNDPATGQWLWKDDDTLIGYKTLTTNQVPEALTVGTATCSAIILGAWKHMLIGFWGGAVEFIVDPYTKAKSGQVVITAMADMGMALRYALAFARCVDARNA